MRGSLIALIGLFAAITGGPAALTQTPPAPPRVGIPGCADDVAVRASRALISFESRGRPVRSHVDTPGGPPNGAGVLSGRVALWGYSRGAGVAVNATTSPESGIRSAVLVAGGGDIDENLTGRGRSFLLMHAHRDEAVPVRARTVRGAGHIMNRRQWDQVYVYALDFFNGNIGRLSR